MGISFNRPALAALICASLLSGCSILQGKRNLALDEKIGGGDYAGAAQLAEERLGFSAAEDGSRPPVTFQPANVLDHLDAAEAWRLAGDYPRSLEHFDAAESALKDVETVSLAAAGGQQLLAVFTNDGALDYKPSPAEAVLVNYYKALNFWTAGKTDDVRVELNRAEDRIRRAVERYESEISAATAEAEKESSGGKGYADPQVQQGVDAQFPEMAQWQPYQNFVVPPATYLHALYLGRSQDPADHQSAGGLYARLVDLVDGNPAVLQDAKEASVGRVCPANDCLWLLVEHGLGPELVERRLTVPVFTLSGPVTVAFALPALQSRTDAELPPFGVLAEGAPVTLAPLASMDRVVQTEFRKRFPGVVTRAVVSATAKVVAQNEVNKRLGPIAGLLANLFTIASTGADVRMWRSMPGKFSLARIKRNGGGELSLQTAAGPVSVPLPSSGSALIHVSAVSSAAAPTIKVLKL